MLSGDGSGGEKSGINLSMGSIGDRRDNAMAETFFASLEKELLRRERFETREHARMRIFWYIECFYNTRRRHSSLSGTPPTDHEQRYYEEDPVALLHAPKRNDDAPRLKWLG